MWRWLGLAGFAVCGGLILIFLLPTSGWRALNVLTGSMRPAIQPGDLVLVHRVALHELRPGDVVTYSNPANARQTITHRYVSRAMKDGAWWVTVKGDANASPDAPFIGGRILGRVTAVIPGLGNVTGLLRQPLALAALVIVPGLIVIGFEVRRLRRLLRVAPTPLEPAAVQAPVPAPPAAPAQPRPRRPLVHLAWVLAVMVALGTGVARAQANFVSLTGNTLAATGPRPTPAPTPVCHPSSSSTTVIIASNNQQTATSGSAENGTSGSASNSNSTDTTVTISNGCQ